MPAATLETPVAFLVFNRPDTTARVFEAIRAARPRTLLVVADGPRRDRPEEAERCREVLAIVDRVDWPCEVLRNLSPDNLGCGRRIASGLSWVFEQVERAIILEDDCLPHPDFFGFCTALLERYAEDPRVSMIGGTNFLGGGLAPEVTESYVYSRYFPVWGWASWRRAWARYDFAMSGWPALRDADALWSFYSQPFMREYMAALFDLVHSGRIDTWDVQWFHGCLFDNALSVIPRRNLVSNIGLTGAHTTSYDARDHELPVFPLEPGGLVAPRWFRPEARYDRTFFVRNFRRRRRIGRRVRDALRAFLDDDKVVR